MTAMFSHQIEVRSHLDFQLNEVPRFWFDNNPYATRLFDSISMLFPVGERFFISSIRPYRAQIQDPALAESVADFCKQEGQHGIQHTLYNDLLIQQGTPTAEIIDKFSERLEEIKKAAPLEMHLATTAALEHMTALMAEAMFSRPEIMANAHPNMRALLAWHAIEEMEHRAVAFDVLTKVVKTSYRKRVLAMTMVVPRFWRDALVHTDQMLKADGFSRLERLNMARKTLPLFFGRKGILTAVSNEFFQYYRRDFHPNDIPVLKHYPRWLSAFEASGDPIYASQQMYAN
ncbi:metal-dependent hydrolase [Aquirhabdus parva]|uniref:Metal-dependent hydrolase n=1 Tax=Aquirhabdus parva TaxID=2283318 RepID=A0A345PAA2_9GAMM|nr:metal-dependent hydrolase [Aquirhabdus parva]AXI04211.1 metal-dependent hydrolase [Aquirhabdus parva]